MRVSKFVLGVLIPLIPAGWAGVPAASGHPSQSSTKVMAQWVKADQLASHDDLCAGVLPMFCGARHRTYQTTGSASSAEDPYSYIFLIATDYDTELGLVGVQFGISYDDLTGEGVDVLSWSCCTDAYWVTNGWPDSGTGIIAVWDRTVTCQRSGFSVIGWFMVEVHGEDVFAVTPSPNYGKLLAVDCALAESTLPVENLGAVGFDGSEGLDPCYERGAQVAAVGSTWGHIKTMYGP
jgi:hypothetical protein